jgi:hypothetical protein
VFSCLCPCILFICISLDLALWRLCVLSYYVKTTCLVISLFLLTSLYYYLVLSMQMHLLIYPLLLHKCCWFMCVRGSYELKMCAFAFKGKNKLCIHLGGAQHHFMNYLWANHIYLANPCVVIKHQKGGDWKSISQVNNFLVFVVNTRVINCLFKFEGLLVNDSEFINPSKVKRSKHRRPRFLVVYFRSPSCQGGLLNETLGWNLIILLTSPLCNLVERTLQKSCCWGFSGRRLRPSEPETPACKGRRLWLWAGDSGQRI